MIQQRLGCAFGTANKYAEQFQAAGLLQEATGGRRNRRLRYAPYLSLFESTDFAPFATAGEAGGDVQGTGSEI